MSRFPFSEGVAMRRFSVLLAGLVAALAIASPAAAAEKATEKPAKIRVLLTYGGHGFEQRLFFAMWVPCPASSTPKPPCPIPTRF